jgi:hypothetical protein
MDCDLRNHFGELLATVPAEDGDAIVFSAANLPKLPPNLSTPHLSITKGFHEYVGYTQTRVDMVRISATRETFRLLGLAAVAKVFHLEPREATIRLTSSQSQIRSIILDYDPRHDRHSLIDGYYQWPEKYEYVPTEAVNYGRDYTDIPNWAKPQFNLTNAVNVLGGDPDWQSRDVIRCAGSEYGNLLFARLLLNAGRSSEARQDFALETEVGYGGVGYGSAEIMLEILD